MKLAMVILAGAAIAASGIVYAQSGPDVLKAKGCLSCHEMDKKKVGPAFKDIATKYKDDKAAEATLVSKLKEGKAHPKISASDAELKAAVGHVLSVK